MPPWRRWGCEAPLLLPVRVERSRDTHRYGARSMGLSTSLEANGDLNEGAIPPPPQSAPTTPLPAPARQPPRPVPPPPRRTARSLARAIVSAASATWANSDGNSHHASGAARLNRDKSESGSHWLICATTRSSAACTPAATDGGAATACSDHVVPMVSPLKLAIAAPGSRAAKAAGVSARGIRMRSLRVPAPQAS